MTQNLATNGVKTKENLKDFFKAKMEFASYAQKEAQKHMSIYRGRMIKALLEQKKMIEQRLLSEGDVGGILLSKYKEKEERTLLDVLFVNVFREDKFHKTNVVITESFAESKGFHSTADFLTTFSQISNIIDYAVSFSVSLEKNGYSITMVLQDVPITDPQPPSY